MRVKGGKGWTDSTAGICDVISSGWKGRKKRETLSNKLLSVLLSTENHVRFEDWTAGSASQAFMMSLLAALSAKSLRQEPATADSLPRSTSES